MKLKEKLSKGWKWMPIIGTAHYLKKGQKEDIKNGVDYQKKSIWHGLTTGLIIMGALTYGTKIIEYDTWNPLQQIEISKKIKQQKKLEAKIFADKKQELTDYVDLNNNNELNITEQYYLHTLMGVENEKKNYKPTKEDWENAYNKTFPDLTQE